MLLAALCLLSFSQGKVHVVDVAGGPGADFTSLRAATLAADDGDVLLVRAGSFPLVQGPRLVGKGLTIVAEPGARVVVTHLEITDLPATSQVLVRGLRVESASGEGLLAADLADNQGPIWLEDCTVETPPALDHGQGGLQAVFDAALVLARCRLAGANPAPFIPVPHALLAVGGRTHLFGCRVEGTRVERALSPTPTGAIEVVAGFLAARGCEIVGAAGRSATLFTCAEDGFDGLALRSASHAVLADSLLAGGAAGTGTALVTCGPTHDGAASIVADGSTLELEAGVARSLVLGSPVRAGQTLQATLVGPPGESVWVRYSLAAGQGIASSLWTGELLLGAPRAGQFVGVIPASGTLSVSAPAPVPSGGADSLVLFAQAAFRSSSGRFTFSAPSALVVVDPRF